EEDGPHPVTGALAVGLADHLADLLDARQDGREGDEAGAGHAGHQRGERRLAGARGAPEDHRMQLARLDGRPQHAAGPQEVLLPPRAGAGGGARMWARVTTRSGSGAGPGRAGGGGGGARAWCVHGAVATPAPRAPASASSAPASSVATCIARRSWTRARSQAAGSSVGACVRQYAISSPTRYRSRR